MRCFFAMALVSVVCLNGQAQDKRPDPTVAKMAYGPHERQVLDFWQAKAEKPTPLVLYIHGGGWQAGDKNSLSAAALKQFLDAGISVAAINYRYVQQAKAEGIEPPVKGPMDDCARAVQFMRSKANEWNLDKQRFGAAGGSAGACSSLWLAFHDDLANPKSGDPIARESTRLQCAAVNGPQTSLDPKQMKEWTPNSNYGAHAFGLGSFDEFLASRDKIMPWIKEYSPYELVNAGDPPVYLLFSTAPALGQKVEDPTHTSNFGVKLKEQCAANQVPCELAYPGAPNVKHATTTEYLLEVLKPK